MKIFLLSEGDSNSRFFHAYANARRKKNRIVKLMDDTGHCFYNPKDLNRTAGDYFKGLFSPSSGQYDSVVGVLDRRVSVEDNNLLLASFSNKEFYQALKQMHLDKVSGPDGFNPSFFQNGWDLTGMIYFG